MSVDEKRELHHNKLSERGGGRASLFGCQVSAVNSC